MKIYVETERLVLREILESDVDDLLELDSDPEVHRFLGNRPLKDKKEVYEVIKIIRDQYVHYGIGRWAVIERSTGDFIGWSGLKFVRETINDHKDFYDIGYRLKRKFWGKGFATESAKASLQFGFNQLNLDEIYAAAHIENEASNRILKKIGLTPLEKFTYDGAVHNWYRAKKEESLINLSADAI